MIDKPFELFKPEDFSGENLLRDIASIANRILNERGKRGFTNEQDGYICSGIFYKQEDAADTKSHEALVFLRPIEKEKCNSRWHILKDLDWGGLNVLTSNCPECGEVL